MIVTDAVFVEGWRSDWLDPSHEPEFDERVQGVVDGLARDCTDFALGLFHDVFGGGVRRTSDCTHHREALCGDMYATFFEDVVRGHGVRLDQVLD